jgi:hypothetical protein
MLIILPIKEKNVYHFPEKIIGLHLGLDRFQEKIELSMAQLPK